MITLWKTFTENYGLKWFKYILITILNGNLTIFGHFHIVIGYMGFSCNGILKLVLELTKPYINEELSTGIVIPGIVNMM